LGMRKKKKKKKKLKELFLSSQTEEFHQNNQNLPEPHIISSSSKSDIFAFEQNKLKLNQTVICVRKSIMTSMLLKITEKEILKKGNEDN